MTLIHIWCKMLSIKNFVFCVSRKKFFHHMTPSHWPYSWKLLFQLKTTFMHQMSNMLLKWGLEKFFLIEHSRIVWEEKNFKLKSLSLEARMEKITWPATGASLFVNKMKWMKNMEKLFYCLSSFSFVEFEDFFDVNFLHDYLSGIN